MTLRPRRFRTALAVGMVHLALAGCSTPASLAPRPTGSFDLLSPVGESAGIRLSFGAGARRVQTLPVTWTQANFTLSSPANLMADRTQSVLESSFTQIGSPQTTVPLFAGSRPGSYTLFASTFNNSVRNALGYTTLTLTAGAASTASITMQTLREWTAGTLVDTAGSQGSLGNGGAPGGAQLYNPKSMTANATGTLYIADSGNNAIRTVDASHSAINAYTWSGSPASLTAPSLLTYDTTNNVLFASQAGQTGVYYITSANASPSMCAAPITTLGVPLAMCYDTTRSALFVAENNHVVEMVTNPEGGSPTKTVIVGTNGVTGTTGSGNGSSVLLNTPQGLAFNGTQYLYIADTGNHRVLRVDLSTAPTYTTVTLAGDPTRNAYAGDGALAASASFMAPAALAYDAAWGGGRLYVLDTASPSVRAIAMPNLMIGTVFGTGANQYGGDGQGSQQATLYNPAGMAFSNGGLFISETGSGTAAQRIRSAQ